MEMTAAIVQLELVRRELRLRWEIATHELECLMEDGASEDALDAKLGECKQIEAKRDELERRLRNPAITIVP